jgi:AraC-like DNA-binding protein
MLLFLSLLGLWMSSILLYFKARNYRSSIYLGVYFFTISLYGLVQYIVLYSKSVFFTSLVEVHCSALFYLSGPMLYWYVRSVVTDNSRLRKSDLWHLLPMTIYLIAALPYFFTPYSRKLEIAQAIVDDPGFLGSYNHTILSELFSNTAMFVSRPLFVLFYTGWSLLIFFLYLKRKEVPNAFRIHPFMNKWLAFFLGFQTLLITSQLTMMLRTFLGDPADLFFTLNILQVFSAIGLTGLVASPFFFPEVLYGLPRYPESFLVSVPPVELPESSTIKTAAFSLDSAYIVYIGQKIESCMQEFRPYCHPDFSATNFSTLISIPVHHLSHYLNTFAGLSFSDFRNSYRVGYAKQMILDGKMEEMTIESIGLSSGFKSRSTFYRVFKNIEGITPGDFAARIAENRSQEL